MAIYNLQLDIVQRFENEPEVDMGVQVGQTGWGDFYLVVGGQIAAIIDEQTFQQLANVHERAWMDQSRDRAQQEHDFLEWRSSLSTAPIIDPVDPAIARSVALSMSRGSLGLPPLPPMPYGHLPFTANTGAEDIFYRWEPFPTSRRIDQITNHVLANTYAPPSAETPFVPTGFAAVARFALPLLFPARWRWEIQPTSGTPIRCGASVPMHGQSGGGVEVMFPVGCANRGPIANPFVIPFM
jgi:hypothetical protein